VSVCVPFSDGALWPSPYRSLSLEEGGGSSARYAGEVNIEDFYAQDERRRASSEIEFGRDWRDVGGTRYELSWVADTGELYLMREPVTEVYEDPLGDFAPEPANLDDLVVTVLGVVTTHERVEEILVGWPEKMAGPSGVEWMLGVLKAAGVFTP